MTPLIAAARRGERDYERELRAELAHLEAIKARDKADFEAKVAEAARMQAEGGTIDPVVALLLEVRADREDGEPEAPAPRTLPAPDFIAPPPGSDSAPWPASKPQEKPLASEAPGNLPQASTAPAPAAPAPSVESAPPASASAEVERAKPAEPAPPKTPPFQVEPDPPPAPKPKAATAKPAHPGMNIPGFSEFLSERASSQADAERAKKVEAARAQGRNQIPASEAFPPDPRGPMEVANFTRIPGGRGIRRVG